VVLVVLAEKGRRTHIHDGSLVMGNLMLAAHALGVGSCWIHRAAETFDMPEWKDFLTTLGLTGDYEGIGNCILGYPEGNLPPASPRREGRVFYVE
jgi:nitroreductase